jgi:hypothetical protein
VFDGGSILVSSIWASIATRIRNGRGHNEQRSMTIGLAIIVVAITSLAIAIGYDSACEPAPALSADAETMKAIVYRCYGSPDVLEYEDVAKPVTGAYTIQHDG